MAPTIGIISIGQMGLDIAQVLKDQNYRVVTNATERSETTRDRARACGVELLPTYEALIKECDYIVSIVPPRDSTKTAELIASTKTSTGSTKTLYYLDLNSIAPATARHNATILSAAGIHLIDGGIMGGPPPPQAAGQSANISPGRSAPSIILSGPIQVPDKALAKTMNIDHISDTIGAATGLKICFGITTKGFNALAIQAFTTAYKLGVLDEMRGYMAKYNPDTLKLAEKGLTFMPPKAYRWVHEMLEIAETVHEDGGFDKTLFEGVAEVYRVVAEDSDLGKEVTGARVRGKTVEDVVLLLSEGMEAKKLKLE